ncbi:MAG: bifunctional aspartate kinase/homoserine dehydrogenase I [Cyclobacteriaceae bacterium]
MLILKFGGTSVGSAAAIKSIQPILQSRLKENQLLVVVSAMSGVTNQLIEAIELAENDDEGYNDIVVKIEQVHLATLEELTDEQQDETIAEIKQILAELKNVLDGIHALKEATPKSYDNVSSAGEKLSSLIVYKYLQSVFPDVTLLNPKDIITYSTDQGHVLMSESSKKAKSQHPKLSRLNICPGFIAGDESGKLVTLGRGGSDYSAALFANFYDADLLEIWSDVDGLMTADPRLVSNANLIDNLSYEEALELSHFGAKVIYPPSIQPAMSKAIPIKVKNTFKQENTGTTIIRGFNDDSIVRGISSIKDISLLNLKGASMVGIPNFSYRLFQALSENQVNVILITQASSEHTICIGIKSKDKFLAEKVINKTFIYEIEAKKIEPVTVEDDLAIVALVGSNMKDQVGISGILFSALGRNGISAIAIAQGSSERNISVVVQQKDLTKSINSLHEAFFENELKRINIFMIGVGNVGKTLLSQIRKQQDFLRSEHNLDLQVIAMANSKRMLVDTEGKGFDLSHWETELKNGIEYSIESFISKIDSLNLRNSIFLDITASHEVSAKYADILKMSVSIATPNKIAATSSQESFSTLKHLERKYKTQYLFETNVCAGLPIISTLRDLVKSGDKIHKIEAVLSGTLNFLFNNYDGVNTFASIVKRAKDEGYSEPDPRLDLSGEDVRRKILILSRESGHQMEMEEVIGESFVPEHCMNAETVDEFFNRLGDNEDHFKRLYEKSQQENKKIRYVAQFEDGKAKTSLQFVDHNHPFYNLEGSDNIVLFFTDRYSEQPLVIKGAGAGAEVTASGIFGDIMKIASAN